MEAAVTVLFFVSVGKKPSVEEIQRFLCGVLLVPEARHKARTCKFGPIISAFSSLKCKFLRTMQMKNDNVFDL